MVSGGNGLGLNDDDMRFTSDVFRDAKKLHWSEGYLRRRERTVKTVFAGRMSEMWKEAKDYEDPLFKKKNWNKIDSGFRLWGSGTSDKAQKPKKNFSSGDDFLDSKNWNDMDSSFRIL